MDTGDKNWATKYLLDPLNAPDPSQEDGPGNTFRPGATVAPVKPSPQSKQLVGRRLSKTNPYRKNSISNTSTTEIKRSASLNSNGYSPISSNKGPYPPQSYPSPPPSATSPPAAKQHSQSPQSPRSPQTPRSPNHRQEAFGSENPSSPHGGSGRRRRGSSLSERYPGDMSHRPLDTLTKEKAVADKARHATRKHHIQPDIIDNLDMTGGGAYHHGGPYDATLFARNNSVNSPLAAVADSNQEALKATPKEKIIDSVRGHRPLDGVAAYAPGNMDRNGNVYNYEEGDNMMIEGGPEGGAYKRWPGVQYDPRDVKGKGEPSYSLEKALKEHKISEEEQKANGGNGIEMKNRNRSSSGPVPPTVDRSGWDGEGLGRSGSIGKRLSGGLKKRFGSIKRSHHRDD
ncbi:uncharacterized protein Z520_05186 [Fonsecaea multimorphosa CBS 102226]|uniref:Pal1 cell morphology protein n=1 Tax=Fonsecaea multimorphosa CBS 102226 TaxID=1442371 RepID=A0A0D2HA15_9EURO|nr:uncharacterized protein Z520_05186 [Fonsecaea multimorphosa CBS 102226]KIX98725.1 hypothetical protein Z520_05186 [Fonsecaea multimorphosa CBS 102226]OAL32934.1 hypothetical protein AYO22_00019 [Fonsecaea multimorphosa]